MSTGGAGAVLRRQGRGEGGTAASRGTRWRRLEHVSILLLCASFRPAMAGSLSFLGRGSLWLSLFFEGEGTQFTILLVEAVLEIMSSSYFVGCINQT